MDKEVERLFTRVTRASFMREVAPDLHIGERLMAPSFEPRDADLARASLRQHGYFSLAGLVPLPLVQSLATAIRALDREHVPASFVFAYDEAWAVGSGVARALRSVLDADEPLVVMPDVWAWFIQPTANARGWKAHRGTVETPTRVFNVWLALEDVTIDNACMYVVPLDRDPHFPAELSRIDVDPSRAVALPATAGTLLGWNSNVLHWGGSMTERASAPRLSLSYTLRAAEAEVQSMHEMPSFEERIDLLADMIATYGEHEGASLDAARRWAVMNRTMRSLGAARR